MAFNPKNMKAKADALIANKHRFPKNQVFIRLCDQF